MQKVMYDGNYAFICDHCDLYINLADLLPRYSDL